MIALKKLYGDELLRLALVLSLLRIDPDDYLERETQLLAGLHIANGSDLSPEQEARTLIRPRFVHPKSLDNILVNYERQLFEELNSLGRYGPSAHNARMWQNRGPILHTYLLNDVATGAVEPVLATQAVATDQDAVSADDNVAQEVKVTDEDAQDQSRESTVTVSDDFLHNRTESDIFPEIASRTFDVTEFLVQQDNMQIKKEQDEAFDLKVNESNTDDFYSDNAIDFATYFAARSEKIEVEEPNLYHQNMADLQDYGDVFADDPDLKHDLELDIKQQQENLEQYLLENTPLEAEVYELAPMFEEELVLDVKRERASTSFTSASSSGVSEMDISDVKTEPLDYNDVKVEPDEGNHTGDELTQEVRSLLLFIK